MYTNGLYRVRERERKHNGLTVWLIETWSWKTKTWNFLDWKQTEEEAIVFADKQLEMVKKLCGEEFEKMNFGVEG
jgi:hypothetical protein